MMRDGEADFERDGVLVCAVLALYIAGACIEVIYKVFN
jgi:hypothetical protein